MSAHAYVVVDLGFGDAGKGTLTDHLARTRGAVGVVRFNGGAQAGHNVVTDDGRHHTFAQLGAGSFVPGVRTHLAAPFVLHPTALVVEAEHLARKGVDDPLSRLTVSPEALVITPYHQHLNQLRERARGEARHGTCGVGVGETVAHALAHPDRCLRARDLAHPGRLVARLHALREELRGVAETIAAQRDPIWEDDALPARWSERASLLAPRLRRDDEVLGAWLRGERPVVFEGAQGVLLDEWRGFHPHTTWSNCTFDNARALLAVGGHRGPVTRVAVTRTYSTRHGAGPFPTEDPAFAARRAEPHNDARGWQGAFRAGPLDLVLARYALAACGGADALALTHCDAVEERWPLCTRYEGVDEIPLGPPRDLAHQRALGERLRAVRPTWTYLDRGVAEAIAAHLGLPLWITSHGPRPSHKRERS